MYHKFPEDPAMLRGQCEHLRRYYQPVAMKQVAAALHTGESLPAGAVAITVDDGYRDFLVNACPVFSKFGIPATVFLVSDFIDGQGMLWWDRLAYGFRNTTQDAISFEFNGLRTMKLARQPSGAWSTQTGNRQASAQALPGGSSIDRRRSREQCRALVAELKKLPNTERTAIVDEVIAALAVSEPQSPPEEFAPLSWDEIRMLAQSNVEFGAHTRTHPILSTLASPEETLHEISYSRDRLANELGTPILHFCYPNGRDDDIGEDAVRITRECGFQTAVTTTPGTNRIGSKTDAWRLKRLGVSFDLPLYYFAELVAGVRTA
jgi:peptidoglycan/xylan/chitin deacetylase (PgdA/CDA1 family)